MCTSEHEHESCACGRGHEHEHEHCHDEGCGCGHEHHHHGGGLKTAVIRLVLAAALFACSYLIPEGLYRRLFCSCRISLQVGMCSGAPCAAC